jgi:hypothetical protein
MLTDDDILLSGIPAALFVDAVHVLFHATELNLDKVLKPPEGALTQAQEDAFECLKHRLMVHRRRCETQAVSEALYDNLGLEGGDRNPSTAMLESIMRQVGRARDQAEVEAAGAQLPPNVKPEDLN